MPEHGLPIRFSPQRVVSLVPSITESLFDLGFGDRVVGITDYCIHPVGRIEHLPRVGGPKNFRIEAVTQLHPDLVIANQEENSEGQIRQLMEQNAAVWLTFPCTVNQSMQDLRDLAGLFGSDPALRAVRGLEQSVEYCRLAVLDLHYRYFCPIWHGTAGDTHWWMTFNGETFSSDLLAAVGGVNVFSNRLRRYPQAADLQDQVGEPAGTRDTRYPSVTLVEIARQRPEYLIFPDEPYSFSGDEQRDLAEQLSKLMGYAPMIKPIDGSLIFWPGTRISKALETLNSIFD